jgi:hypothetical protein
MDQILGIPSGIRLERDPSWSADDQRRAQHPPAVRLRGLGLSGFAKEGGPEVLAEFLRVKTIAIAQL